MSRIRCQQKSPPVDHFGTLIRLGDSFFYGTPDGNVGIVYQIKKTSIVIKLKRDTGWGKNTMNCKSPSNGVCLNNIPLMWQ